MKKLQENQPMMSAGNDRFSRVLLIGAIVLYTIALILLANVAWATGEKETHGALIKVNGKLDGSAFSNTSAVVKSVHGNVLAINISSASYSKLNSTEGVCSVYSDRTIKEETALDAQTVKVKFTGADAVVGILDNSGSLSSAGMAQMKKTEPKANIGFISYLSGDPNSTVIMRNLKAGESNLVQALAYMQEYAKTVNKPLVIEMMLSGNEMENSLFVQICQKVAETGVQFLGESGFISGHVASKAPIQLAFSMFNAETGQLSDQTDFWTIAEVMEQQIMLLGSDNKTCDVFFQTESGFDKVYLSNSSEDIMMVRALTAAGELSYYHVTTKETALIPRMLMNGVPVLEDGLARIYPYHSKMAVFNQAVAKNQFVSLKEVNQQVQLHPQSGMALNVGSPSSGTLAMSLSNLDKAVEICIRNEVGEMVYQNIPDAETQSIQTKINLSVGAEGLYFLDLTSPEFHQTFALLME